MKGLRSRDTDDDHGALLDHMLRTVEDERSLIAHRLHDGPQQVLTAIRLLADGIRHALENDETLRALEGLERLEQLAIEAGDELRQMTARLYPVVMEQLGLLQALGSLGETIEEEYGTLCRVQLPTRWPGGNDDRDTAIYHVARESALHAARNAAAPITIRLSTASDSGELDVSAPACPPLAGAAVLLLRERASRIGGQIEISSGTETRVVLTAPLHP
jgi:two-component system, NarL family, sensor histidine kinase UhpB